MIWFNCDLCEYKCKGNGNLKQHNVNIHEIDVVWFECDLCEERFKTNSTLKQHKANIHEIDVVWFECSLCNYKCKTSSDLNKHKRQVHDIGDNICGTCAEPHYSTIDYKHIKICKKCYKEYTCKSSRIEYEWSDYLDKDIELLTYLISSDKSLKSLGGCCSRRPDKIWYINGIFYFGSCDEHQHKYNNGDYSCEEERLTEIATDGNVIGNSIVNLRFNPDSWDGENYSKNERFKKYKEELWNLINNPPDELIKVYYMFYDEDNQNIVKNIPYEII